METFIGRRKELAALEAAFGSERSGFVPIYGRRRVGKSELVRRFLRGKRGVYFVGKRAPGGLQMREFLREAAVALQEPLLASFGAQSWKEALEAVVDRWKGPGKLVLALDEFQWIVEADRELPSVLQEQWDRRWSRGNKVLLILCGSYVGFMEREVLGRKSPLFGRRTAQILVKPFGYQEAALFHSGWSLVDRARAYFVCGGVPLYLRAFSRDRSVEDNIAANLLDEYAALYREPEFLLREELRELSSYDAILEALAGGASAASEISRRTGVGNRALHYYLKQLQELGYVGKRFPLTGRPPVPRQVRFTLEDPLLRFWFRFVFPNTSFVQQAGATRAFAERVRPGLDAYFGACWERLCREGLPVIYERERVQAGYDVGEYWNREVQIDVVGVRRDNRIDICECRWGAVRSSRALARELKARAAGYPNPRGATIGLRVFTRAAVGGRGEAKDIRWHTLEDLYRT
ncbi:MAG: hypothetical protein FD180_2926 [Planctomycetota bacterium]|nr:MAG: hypothetical protein FD180_2926 [Planctomycetota bacterium]